MQIFTDWFIFIVELTGFFEAKHLFLGVWGWMILSFTLWKILQAPCPFIRTLFPCCPSYIHLVSCFHNFSITSQLGKKSSFEYYCRLDSLFLLVFRFTHLIHHRILLFCQLRIIVPVNSRWFIIILFSISGCIYSLLYHNTFTERENIHPFRKCEHSRCFILCFSLSGCIYSLLYNNTFTERETVHLFRKCEQIKCIKWLCNICNLKPIQTFFIKQIPGHKKITHYRYSCMADLLTQHKKKD